MSYHTCEEVFQAVPWLFGVSQSTLLIGSVTNEQAIVILFPRFSYYFMFIIMCSVINEAKYRHTVDLSLLQKMKDTAGQCRGNEPDVRETPILQI